MTKSSTDYAELQGLQIALSHAELTNSNKIIIEWIIKRINELKNK